MSEERPIICSGCSKSCKDGALSDKKIEDMKAFDPVFCSRECYDEYQKQKKKGVLTIHNLNGMRNWIPDKSNKK